MVRVGWDFLTWLGVSLTRNPRDGGEDVRGDRWGGRKWGWTGQRGWGLLTCPGVLGVQFTERLAAEESESRKA